MSATDVTSRRPGHGRCRSNGLPGYIRIDTVHQGDQEKAKGVYHHCPPITFFIGVY
jgi:hypothetical protein